MIPPLLDTHMWIWWMLGDPRLKHWEMQELDNLPSHSRPFLSDISLWELGLLVELGRVELAEPLDRWLSISASPATVRRLRIAPEIVVEMNCLPEEFHRDPADRLILATARHHGLPLASHDSRIVNSGLVRVWKPAHSN